MRIGIVAFEIDQHSGGMGNWCWQYATALAQRGHEVHAISKRIGFAPLPANIVWHSVGGTSRMSYGQAAEEYLQRLDLDVVHDMGAGWSCNVFQPHGGSHLAWLARRAEMVGRWLRPWKRLLDQVSRRQRDFVRHAERQFDATRAHGKTFVALSHGVANDFEHHHRVRPERIAIVPNGVDCRRFSPAHRAVYRNVVREQWRVPEETTVLLLAAHNFRLKGVPELLSAAGRLAANGRKLHVVIAGGKRLASWRRAAARAGLARQSTFLGSIADMVPVYAAADAYVHPTYYDPCSLVLLEAAASGLPIVTTRRCNGAAELFREGHEILTVHDPRDNALTDRIDAMMDLRLRASIGSAARQVALRHSFERNVAQLIQVYHQRSNRRSAA